MEGECYTEEDIKFDQMIRDMCVCQITMVKDGKEVLFGRFETKADAEFSLRHLTGMNKNTVFYISPVYSPKSLEKVYGDLYNSYIKEEKE